MEQEPTETNNSSDNREIILIFLKPGDLLPLSQETVVCPYLKLDEFDHIIPSCFFKITLNIIFPFMPRSSIWSPS
jgi:hypothetical protein